MATRIYLRNTQTHPGARTITTTYNDMLRTAGTSTNTSLIASTTTETVPGEREFRYLTTRAPYFSERVDAEFSLSSAITIRLRTNVPVGGNGFYKVRARVWKVTHGGSDVLTLVAEGVNSATVDAADIESFTITPATPVAIARNERLILRLYVVPADGSSTFGSTEPVDIAFNNNDGFNDSYIELTETATLRDNGVKLWFRRTAANGIGNFFDMLEARGAEALTSVVPSTAGGTLIQTTRQLMPLVAEVAATVNDTANVTTYASPSFTPNVNTLYLLAVLHSDAATEATVPTISTTTGLNFVQVGSSVPFNTIAANVNRLTLFRAMKPSGLSNGTYTVTLADAGTGCIAQLVSCRHAQTTGSDGANAVLNIVTGSANAGANPSITLAALQQPYHASVGFFGTDIATAPTAGSGLTLLGAAKTIATPTNGLFAVYDQFAPGTTLNATLVASDWGGIGVELAVVPDSTVLEWVSPRLLEGFVATAAANFSGGLYAVESATTINAGLRVEVLRRQPDGTETLMYSKADGLELSSTLANKALQTGTFAGELACHEDDRIVVRAYIVNVGTMAAGGYAGVNYDGPTPNITGDSFLLLLDGPDLKLEADPVASGIVPSGGSLMGLSNGQ